MSKRQTLQICLLCACALAALIRASAAGALTTDNLLVNGDAEQHRCSNDWTAQSSIPGWRVLRGAAVVLCYSAFRVAGEEPAIPAGASAGRALFAAPGADTAMEQTVDVAAAARAIDGGRVTYNLSAWLGGWRDRPERAALTAVLRRNRDAHQALRAHALGHVERKARIVGARERAVGEMRLGKAAHRLGEQLLFLGEIEIHRVYPPLIAP